ncbi:FKBP-type peptidyl-prolyl cis-trans isomerase [Pontixanthobacter gangjinensis]
MAFLVFSCDKDDDNGSTPVPLRDRGEQAIADDQALIEYLSTHFYNYEEFEDPAEDFDYIVRLDTIAGENADKTPIIESEKLITKTVNNQGVDQQLYVLVVREGEGQKPTFADSTYVTYQGELLTGTVFDSRLKSPTWFSLTPYFNRSSIEGTLVEGFPEGLEEFRGATGFTTNPDNTITWNNDFGVGSIFMPSGLAYFAAAQPKIPSYSPIIFNINMYRVNEADHDRDGIPSYMEDLDGDEDLLNDDTDDDGVPNHSDPDDDGDGTPTREEIVINEDGTISFPDSNNNGTPDYLDPDTF